MCFKTNVKATAQLRGPIKRYDSRRHYRTHGDTEIMRVGFKVVDPGRRTYWYTSQEYPKRGWVHGQELRGHTFVEAPWDQEVLMSSGIYLYRFPRDAGGILTPVTCIILRCAYRPADVLGADATRVCLRAVKVLD